MSFQASSEQFEELESPSTILTELLGNEDLSTWDPIGWPPVDLLIETDHSSALVDTALQDINPNLLDCVETNHLFQPTHCLEYDEYEANFNHAGDRVQRSAIETESSCSTQQQFMVEVSASNEDPSDNPNVDANIWAAPHGPTPMA
ncbi:uncharacterized protein CCOS01_08322 [Colletotrichum costaricense]|uniref:Uncharacterized protein n=2 Tax=Colletotrichum acutatum species complex TaxID=2707335 RepID=A0AAI9YWE9_9PEZI|nr:uncharacterized protein CCOS01_08322 [Colletotrichum costaricense]KAK1525904.1 hypothetical protein CCOS01_08322 [Colletotrichum costaricense]